MLDGRAVLEYQFVINTRRTCICDPSLAYLYCLCPLWTQLQFFIQVPKIILPHIDEIHFIPKNTYSHVPFSKRPILQPLGGEPVAETEVLEVVAGEWRNLILPLGGLGGHVGNLSCELKFGWILFGCFFAVAMSAECSFRKGGKKIFLFYFFFEAEQKGIFFIWGYLSVF